MKHIFLKDLVKTINDENAILNYEAVSDALHYLDKQGETELEELKMGYLKKTLTQNELEFMNWHLQNCESCYEDLKFKNSLRKALKAEEPKLDELPIIPDCEVLLQTAEALQKEGKIPEAIESLKEALELKPEDEKLLLNLADILWTDKQYSEARKIYRDIFTHENVNEELRARLDIFDKDILFIDNIENKILSTLDWDGDKSEVEFSKEVSLDILAEDEYFRVPQLLNQTIPNRMPMFANKRPQELIFHCNQFMIKVISSKNKYLVKVTPITD